MYGVGGKLVSFRPSHRIVIHGDERVLHQIHQRVAGPLQVVPVKFDLVVCGHPLRRLVAVEQDSQRVCVQVKRVVVVNQDQEGAVGGGRNPSVFMMLHEIALQDVVLGGVHNRDVVPSPSEFKILVIMYGVGEQFLGFVVNLYFAGELCVFPFRVVPAPVSEYLTAVFGA